MINHIAVRPAAESDAEAIGEITREAFTKYRNDLIGHASVKALGESREDILRDIKTKRVLVAEMNGRPVGSARYELLESGIAYLSRFGVLLAAQSLGVGGLLISRVVDECAKAEIPAVALHTSARMSSLIRFYYGKGFFIHTVASDRGYYRALLIKELSLHDDIIDYASLVPAEY